MNEVLKLIKKAYTSKHLIGLESIYNPYQQDLSGFFIQEIAGRDSIAAFNAFLKNLPEQRGVILSVAFAPTEYGSIEQLFENVMIARSIAEKQGLKVAYAASMDVAIWRELCGKDAFQMSRRYGFYTPCIGCHAYLHLLRAFIAIDTGASTVVSGERVSHRGRVKINQDVKSINAYRQVLAEAGIKFVTPVENVSTDEEIAGLIPFDWKEGELQMSCLYSGNSTIQDEDAARQISDSKTAYIEEFLIPAMKKIISDYMHR